VVNWKSRHGELFRFEEQSRLDIVEGYRRFSPVTAQHNAENQIVHPVQSMLGAVYLNLFHYLPAEKGGNKPSQTQNMVKMSMRQEDLIKSFKANTSTKDLSLCSLTTIDEEAVFFMLDQ